MMLISNQEVKTQADVDEKKKHPTKDDKAIGEREETAKNRDQTQNSNLNKILFTIQGPVHWVTSCKEAYNSLMMPIVLGKMCM